MGYNRQFKWILPKGSPHVILPPVHSIIHEKLHRQNVKVRCFELVMDVANGRKNASEVLGSCHSSEDGFYRGHDLARTVCFYKTFLAGSHLWRNRSKSYEILATDHA